MIILPFYFISIKVIEITLTSILPRASEARNLKYLEKTKALPSEDTKNADRSWNF